MMLRNHSALQLAIEQALMRLDRAMPQARGLLNTECLSDLMSVRLNLVDALAQANVLQ